MTEDLELAELLSSHYDQPIPPAEYHAVLMRRLQVAAGAALRRARTVGMIAAAACLVLVATSAWWIGSGFDRRPSTANPSPTAILPLPKIPSIAYIPSSGDGMKLRDFGPEESLTAASLVVRVRIDGVKGTLVHYTILRTIFGQTEAKSLDFDLTSGSAIMLAQFQKFSRDNFMKTTNREPSDAELEAAVLSDRGIVVGAEEILILQQVTVADGKVELRPRSTYAGSVDLRETQIVDAIRSGKFLEPPTAQPGGDVMTNSQPDGATVVRATLVNLDDRAATWEVIKAIVGTIGTPTVVIPHDLFRLRAEAIARHAALDDATLKDPQAMAARVDAEMKKLIIDELTPHREAILVLMDCRPQGNDTRANLVERAYEDATHKHLDQVETLFHRGGGRL